ncbi:MAG: Ig-like domain-containing protein [Roseburia sp.]|nr:Ig-like domain-containing protein [Roseburia sp.]
MRSKTIKKAIATVAAAAMVITSIVPAAPAQAAVKAKKLTVKTKKIVLYKGAAAGYGSKQLKVTVKPKKAKVTYKINKKKVASVSKKGLVKAKKPGNAKITIKSGSKKVVVKVVVKKIKKKVTKVTATKNITVNVGAKQKIKTSVKPKKATLKALAFTSNAKKIAKVNAKGVITGIKAGNAKITVKAVDGSKKKATVAVLVTGAAIASNPAITTGPSVTTAPTVAPTATVAPTTVPTVAPTAAPTEAPTVAPTEAPTAAPTEAPTVAPTEVAPTAAPVETIAPVVKDNGDLSYNLPALTEGSSYKVSFGEGNNAEITAGAVAAIETIRDRFEASAQKDAVKAAESFVSKAYDNKAFGGFVVNKEAGKDTAVVSYNGKDYNLTVKADGDVAKVAVEGEFSLTVKGANGSYTVSDLKVGSVEGNGAYAATVAVAEDGTVTATITGAAGACTVTVQNGNVTLDIAKAVQEKYGFVISK